MTFQNQVPSNGSSRSPLDAKTISSIGMTETVDTNVFFVVGVE